MNLLFLIAILFFAPLCIAFPENVRKGYPSCASCHVSPTGGGVPTAYGRMSADEILSTWSYEGEGKLFHSVDLPDWLMVGGNTRWVSVTAKGNEGVKYHRKFLMQSEYEGALALAPYLKVAGSLGYYGEKSDLEFRRNYVMVDLPYGVSFRAGKFFPAYGILNPDHRLYARSYLGFGEGRETYNFETSYRGMFGEIFLTGVMGDEFKLHGTDKRGYMTTTEKEDGFAARASLFWSRKTQVGLSYYYGKKRPEGNREMFGLYSMMALSDEFYLAYELNRVFDRGEKTDVMYHKVGYEIFRGFHSYWLHQRVDQKGGKEESGSIGFTWYPRPHFEFTAAYERKLAPQRYLDGFMMMGHYYL